MLILYIPHNAALPLHQGRDGSLPFLFFYNQPLMTLLEDDDGIICGLDVRDGGAVRGGGWLDDLARAG